MNLPKLISDIKEARFEAMKQDPYFEPPRKMYLTQNVYNKLFDQYCCDVVVHCNGQGQEPKETLYGMEIEIIEPADGYFAVGGIMKGVV